MSSNICAVMQPTYLPWIGFFDLIDQVDVFIFLDNVQFSKQSWQQRNRIRTIKGLEWITIPVLSKGKSNQSINQVTIIRSNIFPRVHLRAIEMNYSRAPFFDKYFPDFYKIMTADFLTLSEFNINIITWIASVMGIKTKIMRNSELDINGRRSSLLINICKEVNANYYLSTIGAKDYLIEDHNDFVINGIKVMLHHYEHPEYRQVYKPFIPYAAMIDLLFNEGELSLEIIRSGRRTPSPLVH